jgi:hypothetical protein
VLGEGIWEKYEEGWKARRRDIYEAKLRLEYDEIR